ncbi:MAG: phosphoribosylformylglycinamidine cyclo-ligase [Gemmatimonadota bacterium]|nr:phosphoribosylformylglycinamidine cyclo-ligase [Gemmatimonadota bacterium]
MRDVVTYADSGVDLEAARRAKSRIAELVEGTRTDAVVSRFGSFGGRFTATPGRDLVASADGVGTKLKIAFLTGRHDTVGADLVNHCVDDILTEGARPLVFMDYIGCGVLDPDVVADVVAGLATACTANRCALVGGEMAEMPGFYADGEYDLAGFIVGEAAWPELGERDPAAGDVLIGLPSSGFHTNGYSLVRKLVFDRLDLAVGDPFPGEDGATVGDVLLRTHRSYLRELESSLDAGRIRALAHITGGGLPGNVDRVLGAGVDAVIDTGTWDVPNPFRVMQEASGAPPAEMFSTFNMGIGMVAIVRQADADAVLGDLREAECAAFVCGEVTAGSGRVRIVGGDGPA